MGAHQQGEFAAGKGVARLVRQIERYFPTTIGVWPLSHWLRPTSSECCGVWSKDEEISYEIKAAMNFIQAALNAADIANPFTDEARRTRARVVAWSRADARRGQAISSGTQKSGNRNGMGARQQGRICGR